MKRPISIPCVHYFTWAFHLFIFYCFRSDGTSQIIIPLCEKKIIMLGFICIFFILFKPDGTYHDKIFIALCVIMKILSWTFHVKSLG